MTEEEWTGVLKFFRDYRSALKHQTGTPHARKISAFKVALDVREGKRLSPHESEDGHFTGWPPPDGYCDECRPKQETSVKPH